MNITKAVLIVEAINERIAENISELEMVVDLMELPKYENSATLQERYRLLKSECSELLNIREVLNRQIEAIDERFEIIGTEGIDKTLKGYFVKM